MVYRNLRTRSKIFSFPVYGPRIRRGSSHVCENMTHFLGFRRGNLRPALRIFFVFSRAENAVGNVKWKLKNWKKGSRVEARLVMLYRPVGYYFRTTATISFYASILFIKRCTLSYNLPNESLSFFFLSNLIDFILWKSQWCFKFIRRIKIIRHEYIFFFLTKLSPIISSQIYPSLLS